MRIPAITKPYHPLIVKYYVYDIPANYLIDPNGIIIAKNLNGDELLPTLEKLIK